MLKGEILIVAAIVAALAAGTVVHLAGVKDHPRETEQAAGQFDSTFLDERDYYYNGER